MEEGRDSSPETTVKKKVDESWKNSVQQEKGGPAAVPAPAEAPQEDVPAAESAFVFFLSSLGLQTLVALGEIPNPATSLKTVDLNQARYLIDTLSMLSDKTRGNLTPDEAAVMKDLLFELRTKFVAHTEGPKKP